MPHKTVRRADEEREGEGAVLQKPTKPSELQAGPSNRPSLRARWQAER